MLSKEKQTEHANQTQNNEPCADWVLFEEKRFNGAAPVAQGLFRGEQVQDVAIHQFERFAPSSRHTGQGILCDHNG